MIAATARARAALREADRELTAELFFGRYALEDRDTVARVRQRVRLALWELEAGREYAAELEALERLLEAVVLLAGQGAEWLALGVYTLGRIRAAHILLGGSDDNGNG
jgi:hypothetical protein